MDAIAASELDGGGFWDGGTSDRMSDWRGGGEEEEEEGEEHLAHGIGVWKRGSLSIQDSGLAGEEDVGIDVAFGGDGYGYASYGYGNYGYNIAEWGSGIADSENIGATLPRRGEKRKSDSLSGDGFDRPQTPSSSSGAPGSPLQASSSKGRGTSTGAGTGSLFFKTKLCIKFRAGTCPYNSNCNFAHGMEELRKPPPGWEEMVAVQDGSGGGGGGGRNIKENSSGQLVLSSSDSQRFRRTRRCKKYYSEEGCPYGERCNFLHDDQAKARESNAISLGPPSSSPLSGGGAGGGGGGGGGGNGSGGERPSNWKTRMCNKWEMTGHCPFGPKCNFAHGLAELQMYAGAPVDSTDASDSKQSGRAAAASKSSFPDIIGSSYVSTTGYGTDGHNLSSSTTLRHRSTHSSSSKSQKQVKLLAANWKGPADEISTIYGDWIEEDE